MQVFYACEKFKLSSFMYVSPFSCKIFFKYLNVTVEDTKSPVLACYCNMYVELLHIRNI